MASPGVCVLWASHNCSKELLPGELFLRLVRCPALLTWLSPRSPLKSGCYFSLLVICSLTLGLSYRHQINVQLYFITVISSHISLQVCFVPNGSLGKPGEEMSGLHIPNSALFWWYTLKWLSLQFQEEKTTKVLYYMALFSIYLVWSPLYDFIVEKGVFLSISYQLPCLHSIITKETRIGLYPSFFCLLRKIAYVPRRHFTFL